MTESSPTVDPVQSVLDRADALAESGRVEEAMEVLTRALGESPDEARLLVYAAWASLRLARRSDAVGFAEEAIESDPTMPAAYLIASRAFLASNDPTRALTAIERALALDPGNAYVHIQHAYVRIGGGTGIVDKVLARQELEQALELEPESPDHLLEVVQGFRALRDTARARQILDRGLAITPHHAGFLVEQARLTSGDDDAAHVLTGVLAAEPTHGEAAYLLHERVWSVVREPASSAGVFTVCGLYLGGLLWSDGGIGLVRPVGIALLVLCLLMADHARRTARAIPAPVLRRFVRDAGGWATVGRPLAWAGLFGTILVLLALVIVRSERATGQVVVLASVVLGLAGVAKALLTIGATRAARVQGMHPPTPLGDDRVRRERHGLRSWFAGQLVLTLAIGSVTWVLSGRVARVDALWAAVAWGMALWMLPTVVGLWGRTAELRRRLAGTRTRGLGLLAPVVATVIVVATGAVGCVLGPAAEPVAVDDDGTYGTPRRDPSGPVTFDPDLLPTLRPFTFDPDTFPTFDPGSIPTLDQERIDELLDGLVTSTP